MAKTRRGTRVHCEGIPRWIGGKVLKMLVAIYYGKGVIYYQQYEKLDGYYVAQFISRKYRQMFGKDGKEPSRLFEHDNCPILYCAKA